MSLNGIRFQGPGGWTPAKISQTEAKPIWKPAQKAQPAFSGALPKLDGLDLFGAKGTSALNNAQQNLGDLKGQVGTRLNFLG